MGGKLDSFIKKYRKRYSRIGVRYIIGTLFIASSYYLMNGNPILDAISVGVVCGYLDGRKKET